MNTPVPIDLTSPLYPLPSDYHDLTDEGARLARVNACRQWLIPTDSDDLLVRRRIASTWFFDQHYLHPDVEGDFDPQFYDMPPLATPQMHWEMSRQWALYKMNVTLAPRGSAKSTHCRKDMALCMLSRPGTSFAYCTSTHDNAKFTGQVLRDVFFENSRVHDDWAPEYGALKPSRGVKPTGIEFFHLSNHSWIRCVSAESRLRGIRPWRFRLDDPEYDEKATTSLSTLRTYMENLLFKVAIQMVLRGGAGIDWTGTFVSRRHYLWHALSTLQDEKGRARAADPRFEHWARLSLDVCYEQDGKLVSVWPDMWPSTIADKKASGRDDRVSIEEMPSIMGLAAFNSEMRGRPGVAEEQFFKLDPSPHGTHAYWFTEVDDQLLTSPRTSSTLVHWLDPVTKLETSQTLSTLLANSRCLITVDTAYTESSHSDRRVCTFMAITRQNILFVFDLWSDRKSDAVLEAKTFEMADKWRCPVIHVEVVKESFKLYRRLLSSAITRLMEAKGLTFTPAVKPLKIGMMAKPDKIQTLDTRFEHSLIKLPCWKRYESGGWTRLFDQIEGFNPSVADGGLDKDDEIDTVAMTLFLVRTKARPGAPADSDSDEPLTLLRSGNLAICDMPIATGLNIQDIPADIISKLLAAPPPVNSQETLV